MKSDLNQSKIQNPKSKIVLVHGAFRGGWSWQKVRRILQQNGFEVFAPSLTGAGDRKHLKSEKITLQTWVNDIVNLLETEDLYEIVLVGHSQGGIIIQAVAEAISERISKLIFIDAPVLRDGECALDAIPKEIRERYGETLHDAMIEPIYLLPNADFDEAETGWINARLTAVPTNPSFEKISIKKSANIPHKYIFCSKTPPFYPASYTRKRFDAENVSYQLIKTGHDCLMSEPELVAQILGKLVIIQT
jgi:pimeloyl-ACP methyl ester carboxylesterase